MPFKFNPTTGQLDLVNDSSGVDPFITDGVNGITTIRMQSGSKIWDMTVDDTGAWVSTEVVSGGTTGTPMGLLLALTYAA